MLPLRRLPGPPPRRRRAGRQRRRKSRTTSSSSSEYELHEDQAPGIFTSRADLAESMLEQASDPRFVRKAVAVTTSQGAPTLFQMLRREAFKSA